MVFSSFSAEKEKCAAGAYFLLLVNIPQQLSQAKTNKDELDSKKTFYIILFSSISTSNTAGLTSNCRQGLRWHFRCRRRTRLYAAPKKCMN